VLLLGIFFDRPLSWKAPWRTSRVERVPLPLLLAGMLAMVGGLVFLAVEGCRAGVVRCHPRGGPASRNYHRSAVKVLLVTMYWPPAGGGGVQRPLKMATHLPALGIETHVLAPDDPRWMHRDDELEAPTQAWVHRARYVGPRGRRPADELHGTRGLERAATHARLLARRVLVPDENVSWNLTAIPAAARIVRDEGIDAVVTTSPPNSVHLVGAAVKRLTGARWVADLRDSLVAHPHRRTESLAVRTKERSQQALARLVARRADAVVGASEAIAEEARALAPAGRVVTITNGCDFDDFAGLDYRPSTRFRITHTGSFFGRRDPRPFLTALRDSQVDAVARFVGDFRAADREWAEGLGLGDRLELHPFLSRRRALELQRDSEALLLLIPEADGRGRGVLSGKVFEYLAAERPILAAVPPDGAAAELIREARAGVVAPPDDVSALRAALETLVRRHRAGELNGAPLAPELRARLDRRARVEDLARLLRTLP
jgi:glycosyltransferase involved in cell wall biosynthesis